MKFAARFSCLLVLSLCATARTQTILDDYSSNQNFVDGKYTFVPVFNSPSNSPNVVGGELKIGGATFSTAAYLWNDGQMLSNIGEIASVNLRFDAGPLTAASTHIGLYLSDVLGTSPNAHEVNMGRDSLGNYTFQLVGAGSIPLSGAPTGDALLTVEVIDNTGGTLDLLATLEGTGFTPVTHSFTANSSSLYFGPSGFDVNGVNGVHDDLAFTAVPEPAALATWSIGCVALVGYAVQRRRRR